MVKIASCVLAAALGICSAGAWSQARSGGGSAAPAGDSSPAPSDSPADLVLVLMPAQAVNTRFTEGCWVRFYDHTDYRGDSLMLSGPVDIPDMEVPGNAWKDWDSAIVGPKATVSTFDNENFRDRTATLGPGAYIADLRDGKLGWFDEVHSARVTCLS